MLAHDVDCFRVYYYTNRIYQSKLICAFLAVKLCIFKNKKIKLGQLILRKIVKIVATRCKILRPCWGSLQREIEEKAEKGRERKEGRGGMRG